MAPTNKRKPRGAQRKPATPVASEAEATVNESVVEQVTEPVKEQVTEPVVADTEAPKESVPEAQETSEDSGSAETSEEPTVDVVQEGTIDESQEESAEETVEVAAVVSLNTIDEVRGYLADPDVSIEVKLRNLATHGDSPARGTASVIMSVVDTLGSDVPELEPARLIGRLFTLYTAMKEGVECPDTAAFHLKMDIFHLAFMAYGNQGQAFDQAMLLRYDYLWQWGDDALKTYQVLVVAMSTLANRGTRAEMRKRINLSNSFARTGLSVNQQHIERLINYYEV